MGSSFWAAAHPMKFIYEAMDMAKEEIGKNLGGEKDAYHTHLHSAAYYLNPFLFYSNGFFMDSEVTNGAMKSIVRMSENQRQQELISVQLESYRAALGGFSEKMALDHISQVPPASETVTWKWKCFSCSVASGIFVKEGK